MPQIFFEKAYIQKQDLRKEEPMEPLTKGGANALPDSKRKGLMESFTQSTGIIEPFRTLCLPTRGARPPRLPSRSARPPNLVNLT